MSQIPAERLTRFSFSYLRGGFLEAPPTGRSDGADSASLVSELSEHDGERVGRYKLLEIIGVGGCGAVYMAEQEEAVRRRVGPRIIKLGMDTRSVVARFDAERQALARMDHPNIAKVLDRGATALARASLPGHPARPSEGHHSPRTQALEHSRYGQRRRAGTEGHRFRHRQGSGAMHFDVDELEIASPEADDQLLALSDTVDR